ncbi:hypothetical protein EDD11_001741 [Mortierella claussenii]|nr:hypothetical protein EDD11_001741 [Mortierella claussenii]
MRRTAAVAATARPASDTPVAKNLMHTDSDNDFTSASEGEEEYESMETPQSQGQASSVESHDVKSTFTPPSLKPISRVQQTKMSSARNISNSSSGSTAPPFGGQSDIGHGPLDTASALDKHTLQPPSSLPSTVPSQQTIGPSASDRSRGPLLNHTPTRFSPSPSGFQDARSPPGYHEHQTGGWNDSTGTQQTSVHHGPNAPFFDQSQNVTGSKESGRGWGSFSSWINTAVNTVSEVIENPNMVVSKAHTIGQGIRSAATEHIDKVYESLDPEYEYERERYNKQQQEQALKYPNQTQQQESHRDLHRQTSSPATSLFQAQGSPLLPPVLVPQRAASVPNDNNDISDLLSSSHLHDSPPGASNPHAGPKPSLHSTAQFNTAISGSKLAYNDENQELNGDGWGDDDAWGDDWDGNPEPDRAPIVALSTVEDQQPITSPPNTALSKTATSKVQEPIKNVMDLFSMDPTDRSISRDSGANSALAVPHFLGSASQQDQSPPRRSSSDLRPAEALFSTLDFASNALGSAVLGVHRKVTQGGQPQPSAPAVAKSNNMHQERPTSPAWDFMQQNSSTNTPSTKHDPGRADRSTLPNPSLEVVGGNVVSTGLGALEILGKKAVDVISDVVPSRMNLTTLFEDAGGRAHLLSMRSIASTATARVSPTTLGRPDLLQMGQIDDLEQILAPESLDSAVTEPSTDLLVGHKDFRCMIALLEKMGVQGTSHLRQLRNCARKLNTLVPDSVNAFEQEWHNHQSRASERDFFARAPIKKFFESRLLSIYFDSLKALSQFTDRTCDQTLKLVENFHIRLAEKSGGASHGTSAGDDEGGARLPPLELAQVARQFLGSLIATAQRFTTPLDRLDWEDLSMGVDKLKGLMIGTESPEAIGFVRMGASCIVEVLKNELLLDAVQGRLKAKPRSARPRPTHTTLSKAQSPPSHRSQTATSSSSSTTRSSPVAASLSPMRSPSLEQRSVTVSPSSSIASRTQSPFVSAQPTLGASHVRPTTPIAGTGSPITPGGLLKSSTKDTASSAPSASSLSVRRPSSSLSQNSLRSARAPLPPPVPAPKLKDEDFFSILNDT